MAETSLALLAVINRSIISPASLAARRRLWLSSVLVGLARGRPGGLGCGEDTGRGMQVEKKLCVTPSLVDSRQHQPKQPAAASTPRRLPSGRRGEVSSGAAYNTTHFDLLFSPSLPRLYRGASRSRPPMSPLPVRERPLEPAGGRDACWRWRRRIRTTS